MKSRGSVLRGVLARLGFSCEVLAANDERGTSWSKGPPADDHFEQVAIEYERAIAVDLPADVDAFVVGIEKRGGAHRGEILRLLGIIRKQAAELAHIRSAGEKDCDLAEKLNARETERNAIMNEAVGVAENAGRLLEECASENAELRERLAKLESATRDVLNVLGPEYFDDGKPFEELGRLVNIKGET